MIYLDYAANTPVCEEVLETFCEVSRQYIANPNSPHELGRLAKKCMNESTEQISELLHVNDSGIIYTSSASESNNLAIKGVAHQYKKYGKHIVTTYLEHSSIIGAIGSLINAGFEVDYVDITPTGLVDLEHLKELIREDTILVSICYVDSEVGVKQQIDQIAAFLSDYPHCFFHVDATQAVGKIPVSLHNVDLVTFAPHKFYGLIGCSVLIKKKGIILEPLIHGGISATPFRSGTPDIGQIVAAAKALSLAVSKMEEKYQHIEGLNQTLRQQLIHYPNVRINSTEHSIPHILNISIPGTKTEEMQSFLGEHSIYISTKSACCAPGTISRPVFALTKDKKNALSTLRISLSHLTMYDDIKIFLDCFHDGYNKLVK